MASSSSSTTSEDERGHKCKSVQTETQQPSKWQTQREHDIYSTKLLHALRLVRARGGVQEVRHTTDRVLAIAARGRSRWSRAILASCSRHCCVVRFPIHALARAASLLPSPNASSSSSSSSSLALARKVKTLGGLVLGCPKLLLPALLSKMYDYIAVLEMQVRAMAALAQALSPPSPT